MRGLEKECCAGKKGSRRCGQYPFPSGSAARETAGASARTKMASSTALWVCGLQEAAGDEAEKRAAPGEQLVNMAGGKQLVGVCIPVRKRNRKGESQRQKFVRKLSASGRAKRAEGKTDWCSGQPPLIVRRKAACPFFPDPEKIAVPEMPDQRKESGWSRSRPREGKRGKHLLLPPVPGRSVQKPFQGRRQALLTSHESGRELSGVGCAELRSAASTRCSRD